MAKEEDTTDSNIKLKKSPAASGLKTAVTTSAEAAKDDTADEMNHAAHDNPVFQAPEGTTVNILHGGS